MKKSLSEVQYLYLLLFFLFFCFHSKSQTVRINEFMAFNESTLADEDGEFSDWIEIFNPAQTAVNLQGWALTDDNEMPFKWIFPDITLQPQQFLIIFASSKDRALTVSQLHTNFNLKGSGEYLALIQPDGIRVTEFSPAFPAQKNGYSYGFYLNGHTEFSKPTPGMDNNLSTGIILPAPYFSKQHGFYTQGFQLELNSTFPNVSIYYTTDGSIPSKTNGNLYTSKISISRTMVIRAVAVSGNLIGKVATQSYLFPDDIIRQNNTPTGYPTTWGPYTAIAGTAIADYEMDQELLADPVYAAAVKKSFTEIPVISVVTDKNNLFSKEDDEQTGGIYIYTGAPITDFTYTPGRGWERPISFEYFTNDSSFQVDCGIRIQGGHGRRPEKNPKHSFLLVFDRQYGPSKLEYPLFGKNSSEIFENVILRSSFGNTWVHHDNAQRIKATYQEDVWTKDTQRAIGHPSGKGRYMHLFLNGLYWGMYTASERMDKEFGENYLGGDEDDYDVIKDYTEISDGFIDAWDKMMTMANAGLESAEKYYQIQGKNLDGTPNYAIESMVDVVNLADYMLINFYGGNSDWDHHNWAAMRNRINPGKGFKFLCWDSEMMFGSVTSNILSENNANCPSRVYQQLLKNVAFKRLLADRIQLHCFNGGALTPESATARWLERKALLENVVMAEAARWGDYRRDVHHYQTAGPFDLYKKDPHWSTQQNFILNTYFPQRTTQFVTQLRNAGLFPSVVAPVFYINSKSPATNIISVGDKLTLSAPQGTIYYTTNGTDPVDWNTGSVDTKVAKSYSQAVTLNQSVRVIARSYYNGQWSAASAKFFVVPDNYNDIKITEIHYHPLGEGAIDKNDFEFVELKNTGNSTLDISGMKFTRGIDYVFPSETQLGAGEFMVLGAKSNPFLSRYKFRPFDVYIGKLDNAGERLTLVSPFGATISDLVYGTSGDWPSDPDGLGYSLVPVVYNPVNNQNTASEWRTSHRIGGSPGADDIPPSSVLEIYDGKNGNIFFSQNYPNPFSDITYIDYQLNCIANVEISVYNIMGLKVATLFKANQQTGMYQVTWNGSDVQGNLLPNGIYFYKFTATSGTENWEITNKMALKR